MKLYLRAISWPTIPKKIRGMFNLNDSRWGRGDDKPAEGAGGPGRPESPPPEPTPPAGNDRPPKPRQNATPPDLDELWRDFTRKLGGMFGGAKSGGRGGAGGPFNGGGGGGGGFQPDMKHAGIGLALLAGSSVPLWPPLQLPFSRN